MPRRTVRFSADADERLQATAKVRGYANPRVFLRAAIDHELTRREDAIIGAEERLATSLEQMSREASENSLTSEMKDYSRFGRVLGSQCLKRMAGDLLEYGSGS